jgi:glycosidase
MKRKILALFVLLLLSYNIQAQSAWAVLAGPLQMGPDSLRFDLHEYFPYIEKIDSVKAKPYSVKIDGRYIVLYANKQAPKVIDASFFVGAEVYHVPVYASMKQHVDKLITLSQACSTLAVKGSFSNWTTLTDVAIAQEALPAKVWKVSLKNVNEGKHEYKLIADGKEVDALNEKLVSNGMGGTNAQLEVGDGAAQKPRAAGKNFQGAKIEIELQDADGYFVYWQHNLISSSTKKVKRINITIPGAAAQMKRSYIRVFAYNANSRSNDMLIPLEKGRVVNSSAALERSDLHTQIMYFMMVDRFNNGNKYNDPAALKDVQPKADFMGGDIQGIAQKITSGYFQDLGFNTLWLSPISKNPDGAYGLWTKGITTKFSAYHGYWPTSYSQIDHRFGTDFEFSTLLSKAHGQDMNVVLDFVAHHIHTEHPLYRFRPQWTTPLYLPDGTMNTERWDDYRLTTWFDTFLPTLDFQQADVTDVVSDSVMLWLRRFDIDGFRHDASKHVPDVFWKTLTYKIRREQKNKGLQSFYQIGETYGSPELISSYVNAGQMDGQFDFNLYDVALETFAYNTKDIITSQKAFNKLKERMTSSTLYYGSHHLMGNISGNQDKPRFMSMADGSVLPSDDAKLIGWTQDVQVKDTIAYDKLAQMMAFNFTVPGVPIVYYGDEIGMPGANDPDNRRMMRFDNLSPEEQALRDKVQKLCALRASQLELLYGETRFIECSEGFFIIERDYFGKKSYVIFSKQAGDVQFNVTETATLLANFGHSFQQEKSKVTIQLKANDFEILQTQ